LVELKFTSFKKVIIVSFVLVFSVFFTKYHTVHATASDYYEKEFNDTIETANTMKLNQTYKGTISDYNYDEMDVYKITVPNNGDLTLSIKKKAGMSWNGHIQNSAGEVYLDLVTDSDELVSGNSEKIASLKKGVYYIVMQDLYDTSGHQYEVKASIKSSPLLTSNVKVFNNSGGNDMVTVSNIAKGDTVKVYNASNGGNILASKQSTGSSVSLSIKQLGEKSGKIYVTVTRSGMAESNRIAVSYSGEKSKDLTIEQIKVNNNKGKNDLVTVSKIAKGDTVKVYSASKAGHMLASKLSTGSSVSLSIKQLGTKSGKIYVTVVRSGMLESSRVAVGYTMEVGAASLKVVKFANCKEMNKVYEGGVARSASIKNKGGKTKYKPFVSKEIYDTNKKSDRDKDLIACER
jgi:hypothetical protein